MLRARGNVVWGRSLRSCFRVWGILSWRLWGWLKMVLTRYWGSLSESVSFREALTRVSLQLFPTFWFCLPPSLLVFKSIVRILCLARFCIVCFVFLRYTVHSASQPLRHSFHPRCPTRPSLPPLPQRSRYAYTRLLPMFLFSLQVRWSFFVVKIVVFLRGCVSAGDPPIRQPSKTEPKWVFEYIKGYVYNVCSTVWLLVRAHGWHVVRYTGGVKKTIRKLDLSTEMSRRTKDKEVASINVRVLIRSSDPHWVACNSWKN